MDITQIEPPRGKVDFKFRELWRYRELLYFLVWRNLKVRYKQTVVGVAWVVIQPLLVTLIFSVTFGNFLKIPSQGVPYAPFVFCAFLPWSIFSNAVSKSGDGLVLNRNLITKIYFPRILIPIAITAEFLFDFFISCLLFFIFMALFRIRLTLSVLFMPVFAILAILLSLGVSFWLSALNVRYRDIRYAVPFMVQAWFFVSPIAYATSSVADRLVILYSLNPMVGIIDGFRWSLLGTAPCLGATLPASLAGIFIIFISGAIYFSKTEKTFADII